MIAQHRQTWKIREHVLLSSSDQEPLPPGEPLRAFIPENAVIKESSGEAMVQRAGESVRYVRSTGVSDVDKANAKDIIITGDVCYLLQLSNPSADSPTGTFRLGTV